MIRGVLMMLWLATLPLVAQQELGEHKTPIAEQLDRVHLDADSKQAVQRALDNHDYTAAESLLVKATEADSKSPELLILAARVFLLDHNPMNAAIAFKKAEKLQPLAPPDRFSLAMAYLGIGKGAWARPELDRLAAQDAKNPLYQYWLARIDYDEHKYDDSVGRLRAVTLKVPEFPRGWDNLGLSLEATGKLADAVAAYREASRLNRAQKPCSPWPPLNLGSLLTKMGELKEAEQVLREAVGYDPKLGEARYRLGLNLHKQGRESDAIAELRLSSELDPNATEPLYTLGQIYRQQGDSEAADKAFERFRELKKKQRGT